MAEETISQTVSIYVCVYRTIHMIEAVQDRLEGSPRQLRRFWSDEFQALAVEEASRPGANISAVARRIGILPSQIFRWRRELSGDGEQRSALAKEQQRRSGQLRNGLSRSSLATLSCAPDSLLPLVRDAGNDPFNGALYVSRAKWADRVKIVWWDGSGICLYTKRLEKLQLLGRGSP
ncbi:IS66 family insertion sequence element accessory protein TnpB [Xaviernesmea oryzae]|uniref:IS66 family insertion sequence element accessory protein TnpB n=1 Tax=Xaviernesmea oryzae TaxID=464029 RepID=UPI000A18F93C|nr:IS66 family insertion sequence element accessory protein TnpB [Xaviernesmea oryzae]